MIVQIDFPKGIKSSDLSIEMKAKHLKAGLKGKDPVINGELDNRIKVEDSTWTIEDS